MKILIVEDNIKTIQYLKKGLSQNHFVVEVACDGIDGLHMLMEKKFDLIILDIMLPKLDGWQLALRAKNLYPNLPILFLTACDSIEERVRGFDTGADDYLIKPFAFAELLARIRNILRRQNDSKEIALQVADLKIDASKHIATRNNKRLHLSAKEFMLLLLLASKQGEVLSRTYIAAQVWDINFDSESNAVEVAIKRLREKMDQGFNQKLIHTVRGVGYVLEVR